MNLMGIVHEEFSCYRDGLKIRGSMFRPKAFKWLFFKCITTAMKIPNFFDIFFSKKIVTILYC